MLINDIAAEMDLKLLCGILIGIALGLLVFIGIIRWKAGRAARKGKRGEHIVSKKLHCLKQRENIILNNVLLPAPNGRTSQVDHIVISTRGIFVIETKSLAGRITGSEHAQYWTQHLSTQTRQLYNPILQNKGHIRVLSHILPDLDSDLFVSMIVFTEAWQLDIKADDIVEKRTLLPDRYIRRTFMPAERKKRRWWRSGSEVRLDESIIVTPLDGMVDEIKRRDRVIEREDLEEIQNKIERVALKGNGSEREHVAYARETSRNISRGIRQGICPRCGGCLTVKKGPKGEFVGCENYPSCRFTCSVDHLH